MHGHRLNCSLMHTSRAFKRLNREVFEFANTNIKGLECELESLKESKIDLDRQRQIQEDLSTNRARMESINRQKSREL